MSVHQTGLASFKKGKPFGLTSFTLRFRGFVSCCVATVLLVCFVPQELSASDSSGVLLNVRLGGQFGIDANEFFSEYQRTTQMPTSSFDVALSYAAAFKFKRGEWNVGLNVEYWTIGFGEDGQMHLPTGQGIGSDTLHRQLQENVKLHSTPILLSLEYAPYTQQFRNYIGAAGGVALIRTYWSEMSNSTLLSDARTGGTYIDNNSIKPMARVYCGVVLGFDHFSAGSNGSLIIEAAYTWCANSQRPWSQLARTEKYLSAIDDRANNIGVSSLSLALGFQFHFSKK